MLFFFFFSINKDPALLITFLGTSFMPLYRMDDIIDEPTDLTHLVTVVNVHT